MAKTKNNFVELTASYEQLFEDQLKARNARVVRKDWQLKHRNMAEAGKFVFFRGVFYARIKRFYEVCPEQTKAPIVNAIGDIHVENFGTWRDAEGRLCYGINDFDEAFPLPFTVDLAQLACSAKLAIEEEGLRLSTRDACDAILTGYTKAISSGGQAFVLGEEHPVLREMAVNKLKVPGEFWNKLTKQVTAGSVRDISALKVLEESLPSTKCQYKFGQRTAGQGSLGRPRYVVIAFYNGGKIAREVKIHIPSACFWAGIGNGEPGKSYYNEFLNLSLHSPDPFLRVIDGWVSRRLSPDCSRIELSDLPSNRDEYRLLQAQGAEIANIHLGTQGRDVAARILKYLAAQEPDWLRKTTKKLAIVTCEDQETWAEHYAKSR